MGPREFEEKYPPVSKETYDKAVSYYQNENKRLREALEFYASSSNNLRIDRYAESSVMKDEGRIARQALECDSQ